MEYVQPPEAPPRRRCPLGRSRAGSRRRGVHRGRPVDAPETGRRRRGRRPDGWCRGNHSAPGHRRATECARGGHRRGRHLHAVRDLHAAERAVLRRHRQRLLRNARLRHLSGRPGLRRQRLRRRASCVALVCQVATGNYCGTVGNGCGRAMDCGACDTSLVCTSGVCVPGAGCVPLTCTTATGRYCGTIGDGCGGTLPCGDCPTGSTCGGAGVANTCAPDQLHARHLHGGGRRPLLRQHR